MFDDVTKAISLARDAQKYFTEAEAKMLHAELMEALADAKARAAELQSIILDKDRELAELRKSADLDLSFDEAIGVFFDANNRAYCTKCYQSDSRVAQMKKESRYFRCAVCGMVYQHTPDDPRPRRPSNWMGR